MNVLSTKSKQIINKYCTNASPSKTPVKMLKDLSPSGEHIMAVVIFIKCHFSSNNSFGKTICKKYLLHLFSVYGIEFFEEIYEQWCGFKFFYSYSSDISMDCQNLGGWGDSFKSCSDFSKEFSWILIWYD